MSFFSKFFSCCSTSESDQKYLVKTANGETSVYNSLDEIDKNIKENKDTQITKIKTQAGLQTKKQQLKEKNSNFIDGQFLHDNNSIGKQHSTQIQWKRIPELLPANVTPVIFDSKIQPSDVITGHEGDCYFLSSLAALAQSPKTIRQIFKDQTYNKQGIYHLNLRNHGVIEEVVIDDYIPVDENGTPLYCQPNARTGQFWVVLVQKAIAKTKGSYQELEVGTPSQIFRAVGHAPAQSIVFSNTSEQKERIWATLLENNNKNNPICATTVNNASHHTNLQNSHTYTVVKAIQFHNEHHSQRVIKIRNPWKQINYNGKASSEDNTFWNSIHAQNKQEFLSFNNGSAYGLATIHLDDFIANFNQIHISNTNGGGKYLTQPLSFSDKKGKYFEIDVDREGSFTFELNQSKVHNKKLQPTFQSNSNPHQQNHQHQNEVEQIHIESEVEHKLASLNELRHTNQPQQEVFNQQLIPNQAHNNNQQQNNPNEQRCGRSTLMIFQKDRMSNNYKFVNGIMKYNQQNTTLTEHLSPGTYVIYSKIDHIVKSNRVPQNACLSLYSTNYANLRVASPSAHINLFHNAFLNHAENNKKIEQSQGKVWISYQLLFQKGGYAYFAVGNAKDNNQAVVVNFNPADFDSLNFYLKQPHKNITQTVMRILPGQRQIIIAKVKNDPNITSAKFPPKLDIKLEPLFNKNI